MKPSIGRIVHVFEDGVTYAAVITRVWTDTCVNVRVFREDEAAPLRTSVPYDDAAQSTRVCSWRWPPRVDG